MAPSDKIHFPASIIAGYGVTTACGMDGHHQAPLDPDEFIRELSRKPFSVSKTWDEVTCKKCLKAQA